VAHLANVPQVIASGSGVGDWLTTETPNLKTRVSG
jgi:hypothetical protein